MFHVAQLRQRILPGLLCAPHVLPRTSHCAEIAAAFLFSFSIISSVGYGNIAPVTNGGKFFTIIFALLGIPIVLGSVGICAGEVLFLFEWIAVARMDQVRMAFEMYDSDSSGLLDQQEFRSALNDLGIRPTDADFALLVRFSESSFAASAADFDAV